MKYFIYHNGCESVLYDYEKKRQLIDNIEGMEYSTKEDAEFIIIFTCTFTLQKEIESKIEIEKLLLGDAKHIVVSGCFLKEYFDDPKVHFIKTKDLEQFIFKFTGISKTEYKKDEEVINNLSPVITISNGCFGHCTYCSIKLVKGVHKSRKLEDILKDVDLRKHHGYIKLVGEDIAGYGLDVGTTLYDLVTTIITKYPQIGIRFGSLNLMLLKQFSKEQLGMFALSNIMGNIHIPIQSASNNVLDKMQRGYKIEDFEYIYSTLKNLSVKNISTDIISGFPLEDNHDHEKNIEFIKQHHLQYIQVFKYQERPGTKAALMEQLVDEIREQRTMELIVNFINCYTKNNDISINELVSLPQIFNTNINFNQK